MPLTTLGQETRWAPLILQRSRAHTGRFNSGTKRAPVVRRRQTGVLGGSVCGRFYAENDRVSGVAVGGSGEVRNRVHPEPDAEEQESGADPDGPAQRRPEVADDQERRSAGDLVRRRYPGRLAAREREATLDRRDGDADQAVDDHRLEERGEADEHEEPAGAGQELQTVRPTAEVSEPSPALGVAVGVGVLRRRDARAVSGARYVVRRYDVVGGFRVRHACVAGVTARAVPILPQSRTPSRWEKNPPARNQRHRRRDVCPRLAFSVTLKFPPLNLRIQTETGNSNRETVNSSLSAETTWFARLFHMGITRLVKLNFLKS